MRGRFAGPGNDRPSAVTSRGRQARACPACLFSAAVLGLSLFAGPGPEPVFAIKGGVVLTMAGPPIPVGTVLVRGGLIAEVGSTVEIPSGARIIDAAGKYVLPGLIDAMTYHGLSPADRNDAASPATPENRAVLAYRPDEGPVGEGTGIRSLLEGGVTTIYIAPGNTQAIGGQGAVVKTFREGSRDAVLLEPASVDMALGDSVRSPSNRPGVAALIRRTLAAARASMDKAKDVPDGGTGAGSEALAAALRRERPVRVEADLPDDIRMALRIAEEFDLAVVIDGGAGASKVGDVLAARGVPVVLGPVSRPFVSGRVGRASPEPTGLLDEANAALLFGAGVKLALASFGFASGAAETGRPGRWILLEAALAAGFGLPEDAALKAVTLHAAEILGVASRVGSLEKGKDADIIILDGPPLALGTRVDRVYVQGRLAYD